MPIPENAQAIWNYLTGAGLSANATAGILGNIEQESGGSATAGTMSGGYGLIQWTPGSQYFSSPPSLDQQMPAIVAYIKANGSIADINAHASTPQAAALYFSQNYERPNPGLANNPNREQSAADVLAASKSGDWKAGAPNQPATTDSAGGGLFSWPGDIVGFFKDAKTFVDALLWIVNPASWLRIGSFMLAGILLLFGVWVLVKVGSGEPIVKAPSSIPIPVPV